MAQGLGALAALTEAPVSVLSTYMVNSQGPLTPCPLLSHGGMCSVHTYKQSTHIHKIITLKNKNIL